MVDPKRRHPRYAECIQLRVEQRFSLTEIHQHTGVSKGTLYGWLKPYPLTADELTARRTATTTHNNRSRKKDRGPESKFHHMAAGRKLTPGQIGRIGEAAILLRLAIHGLSTYGSLFDGDRLDWVAEREDGQLVRLQVKMAVQGKDGLPYISLRRRKGYSGFRRLTLADCDFVVAYDLFSDKAFVWSLQETGTRHAITINPDAEERWDKLLNFRP